MLSHLRHYQDTIGVLIINDNDNCIGVPISHLLTVFRCLFSIVCIGAFNQEKALVGATVMDRLQL